LLHFDQGLKKWEDSFALWQELEAKKGNDNTMPQRMVSSTLMAKASALATLQAMAWHLLDVPICF
jgi:hypothetical protein